MNQSKAERNFLLFFLLVSIVLAFFIFKPFLYAIILAIVVAIVFDPVHKKILNATRNTKALSALLSTVVVLILLVVPISFLGVQIIQESSQLYSTIINEDGADNLTRNLNSILLNLFAFSPVPIEFSLDVNHYVRQGLEWLLQNLAPLFASFAQIVMSIFIFLIALYYMFKDGHRLKDAIISLSPLSNAYEKTIFDKLALAVNSVIKGSLAVALVQGALTATGLFLFGVPNPILWGTVAAVTALIPGIGTAIVILPAVLYLFLNGEMFAATGLLIWGLTAVGLIDNFLAPKLIERGIRLHSFLVMLSILGGLIFFGPIGFLLGPLVLSTLFVLLEIYSDINKTHAKQQS